MMAGDIVAVSRSIAENDAACAWTLRGAVVSGRCSRCSRNARKASGRPSLKSVKRALEYKIDGFRIQTHKSGEDARIHSRRLNDVTPAIPEIGEAVRAPSVPGMPTLSVPPSHPSNIVLTVGPVKLRLALVVLIVLVLLYKGRL